MPEMTLLGWFHTVLGSLALITGFFSLPLNLFSWNNSSNVLA